MSSSPISMFLLGTICSSCYCLHFSVICSHKEHYSRALIIFPIWFYWLRSMLVSLLMYIYTYTCMCTFPYEGVWNPGENLDVLPQEGHFYLETNSSSNKLSWLDNGTQESASLRLPISGITMMLYHSVLLHSLFCWQYRTQVLKVSALVSP